MILVDTSVLVDFLRGLETPEAQKFVDIQDQRLPFGISDLVYQEVLMGARNESEWRTLDDYFATQRFYALTQGHQSYREAARIYYDCRRRGLTIRSTVDCIMAQIAIEHSLSLLAKDRDYRAITRVSPLRLW